MSVDLLHTEIIMILNIDISSDINYNNLTLTPDLTIRSDLLLLLSDLLQIDTN